MQFVTTNFYKRLVLNITIILRVYFYLYQIVYFKCNKFWQNYSAFWAQTVQFEEKFNLSVFFTNLFCFMWTAVNFVWKKSYWNVFFDKTAATWLVHERGHWKVCEFIYHVLQRIKDYYDLQNLCLKHGSFGHVLNSWLQQCFSSEKMRSQ